MQLFLAELVSMPTSYTLFTKIVNFVQTLSSPRSMFAAQLIGAGLAVVISPAAFWLYWSGFNVGSPFSEYK